jgi:hypothetical protein
MIEGLAFLGARASWRLQHSAMPDAPVVPDRPVRARRGVVRLRAARALRSTAEMLERSLRPAVTSGP